MSQAFVCGAGDARPDQRWNDSAGDLAVEAAGALIEKFGSKVDTLVVAGAPAAIIADRLGLAGKVRVLEAGGADGAGAQAVQLGAALVQAGVSRCALVLGVAKVSDLAERDRATLLDATIDPEAEAPLGLTYQALAGVLADLYLQRHSLKASAFAQVTAKNAAGAIKGGETYWSHAPSVLELARDLPAAPPLGRSDFAPILDGASCVLIADQALATELCPTPVEIVAQAARSDWSVVADRPDPLAGVAVAQAAQAALKQAGLTVDKLGLVEISSACSLLETIAAEGLGLCAPGGYGARCKEGAGPPVNPGGGEQGRGLTFGTSGVAQAREIFLQLGPGAGARQVAGATSALSVGLAGLATQAFVTVYRSTGSGLRPSPPAGEAVGAPRRNP